MSEVDYPEYLYHYTSLETLALILENRTLCLNNLAYVDDLDEVKTSDMGLFGRFFNVSCWTSDGNESIPLWKMYTPDMHGVRIKLPPFPFKKFSYHKGEYFFSEDVETYINEEKVYNDNRASIVSKQPQLIQVEYTDDPSLLFPKIKTVTRTCDPKTGKPTTSTIISFSPVGKYKGTAWAFQKEWRYIMSCVPMGMKEYIPLTFETQTEIFRRLEDPNQKAPYEKYFLDLEDSAVQKMEVLFGPRMTEAEKILAVALLEKHGLAGNYSFSALRIK